MESLSPLISFESIKEFSLFPMPFFKTILSISLLFFIFSCSSDRVNYHTGLYTTDIFGAIDYPKKREGKTLLIVEKLVQTFIDQGGQALYDTTAVLYILDKNTYKIPFPASVKEMKLLFLSEGFKPEIKSFNRSLGIGEIEYNPFMEKDPHWRDNYFVNLKPYLTGYFLQSDRRMIDIEQLQLANWITKVEKKL